MGGLIKGCIVGTCVFLLIVALFGCATSSQMNEDEVFTCDLIVNQYGDDEVFCE